MGKDRSYTTAIHILTSLAFNEGRLLSSETLAIGLQTNPGLIRRVLLKLSDKGLVESIKGKGGGNRLAKKPSQIDLAQVYTAIKDTPLFGSFDKNPYEPCKVSCNIGRVLTGVYSGLEVDLIKSMKKIKLTEIMADI